MAAPIGAKLGLGRAAADEESGAPPAKLPRLSNATGKGFLGLSGGKGGSEPFDGDLPEVNLEEENLEEAFQTALEESDAPAPVPGAGIEGGDEMQIAFVKKVFPDKGYTWLSENPEDDTIGNIYVHHSVANPLTLEPAKAVAFKPHMSPAGKLQASAPLWALMGKVEEGAQITFGQYIGTIENVTRLGDGFVNCPELKGEYKDDVYIFHKVMFMCGLMQGHEISFDIHINAKGQPQVQAPVWVKIDERGMMKELMKGEQMKGDKGGGKGKAPQWGKSWEEPVSVFKGKGGTMRAERPASSLRSAPYPEPKGKGASDWGSKESSWSSPKGADQGPKGSGSWSSKGASDSWGAKGSTDSWEAKGSKGASNGWSSKGGGGGGGVKGSKPVKPPSTEDMRIAFLKQTVPEKGFSYLSENPVDEACESIYVHSSVASPETLEAAKAVAFKPHVSPKGALQASAPVWVLKGKVEEGQEIFFGEYFGVIYAVTAQGDAFVDCPALKDEFKDAPYIFHKVMNACRLQEGDEIAFEIHINSKGQPQVQAPVWKKVDERVRPGGGGGGSSGWNAGKGKPNDKGKGGWNDDKGKGSWNDDRGKGGWSEDRGKGGWNEDRGKGSWNDNKGKGKGGWSDDSKGGWSDQGRGGKGGKW
eukprot:TRINITY_DN90920_c0_g1_i1.p1 TRINITY_DN90920_c0_g1~~TRINITY_DN90920_c0_g1_i1.p1  ORF type:complete len:662 (-),score=161.68 TRINITY_DN90920_c0_g1_i1:181-2112(-)